jgi:hypothetical protein
VAFASLSVAVDDSALGAAGLALDEGALFVSALSASGGDSCAALAFDVGAGSAAGSSCVGSVFDCAQPLAQSNPTQISNP